MTTYILLTTISLYRMVTMKVRVRAFANLKAFLGFSDRVFEVEENVRLNTLIERIIQSGKGPVPQFLVALNHEYVSDNPVLGDGDEIAIFPPVSGG